MTNRSKQKGTAFETEVLRYLQARLEQDGYGIYADMLHRRALTGNQDRGDIGGWSEVVIECKNQNSSNWAEWMDETEVERQNDGAAFGLLVVRRRMKTIDKAYAVMPLGKMVSMMEITRFGS